MNTMNNLLPTPADRRRIARFVTRAEWPGLDADGVGGASRPINRHEVAAARAYIRTCGATQTAKKPAYRLKHQAERWAAGRGLAGYVSPGALIAAAIVERVPVRCTSYGAVLLGVAEPPRDERAPSTRPAPSEWPTLPATGDVYPSK